MTNNDDEFFAVDLIFSGGPSGAKKNTPYYVHIKVFVQRNFP